jgi:small subunit ribosomal protein S6
VTSGAPASARIDRAQERKTKMSQDKATYEGMFLLDAGNPDFQAASEPVRTVLDRNEASALSIKPWDERRLAYEINGRRRGLYVLTYFEVEPGRITEIERDCQLDERILRVLLLRRDDLTDEIIEAATPATAAAQRLVDRRDEAKAAEADDEAEVDDAASDEADAKATEDDAEAPASDTEAEAAEAPAADADAQAADAPADEEK